MSRALLVPTAEQRSGSPALILTVYFGAFTTLYTLPPAPCDHRQGQILRDCTCTCRVPPCLHQSRLFARMLSRSVSLFLPEST